MSFREQLNVIANADVIIACAGWEEVVSLCFYYGKDKILINLDPFSTRITSVYTALCGCNYCNYADFAKLENRISFPETKKLINFLISITKE